MCQESWACPQQRTGSQPATRMGPGGLTITHTGGPLHPPASAASPTGGQSPAAGNSQSPSRGLLQGHLVSRFRRAEASPIYTPTRGLWFCLRSKRNRYPADSLPQKTKSTVGSLTPHTVFFSPKMHGPEMKNSKPYYLVWIPDLSLNKMCHLRQLIFKSLCASVSSPLKRR